MYTRARVSFVNPHCVPKVEPALPLKELEHQKGVGMINAQTHRMPTVPRLSVMEKTRDLKALRLTNAPLASKPAQRMTTPEMYWLRLRVAANLYKSSLRSAYNMKRFPELTWLACANDQGPTSSDRFVYNIKPFPKLTRLAYANDQERYVKMERNLSTRKRPEHVNGNNRARCRERTPCLL